MNCRSKIRWTLLLLLLCTGAPHRALAQGVAPGRASVGATAPPTPSLLRGSSVARAPGGWVQAPRHRLVLNNLLVLRLNPVGLEDQVRFGYQLRFSDSTSLLRRDNFLFLGIAPRFNPAFVRIGPSIEIQPLSILNLRVGAEYMGFFRTFGFLQSFDSPAADYADRTLKANQDAGQNYVAHGFHLMLEPLLQLRLGPVALRNKFAAEYWYMNTRDQQRVFYEVTLDTLVPRQGWVLANDLDLLLITRFGLTVGARYSLVKPLYSDDDFPTPADRALEDNGHHRLGPMVAYTFFDRGFTGWSRPTLLLIANWYLDHRYRTGQAESAVLPGVFTGSAAMPYLILGFSFQSDLLRR